MVGAIFGENSGGVCSEFPDLGTQRDFCHGMGGLGLLAMRAPVAAGVWGLPSGGGWSVPHVAGWFAWRRCIELVMYLEHR